MVVGGSASGNTATCGDENLLIGDSTIYDANDAALSAIVREWGGRPKRVRADWGPSERGGVRRPGGRHGEVGGVRSRRPIAGDAAIDQLFGTADLTWFWNIAGNDVLSGKRAADQVN